MDDTKDRILANALSLFAERGYNAVGVQEICDSSGITKPTLYYHFGSKAGLLESIASSDFRAFLDEIADAARYRKDLAASLVGALGVFLRGAAEKPSFMRLRLALAFSPPASEAHQAFRPYSERLSEIFRTVFREAAEDHGNMRGRELAYAASFIGTADAYAGLLLSGNLEPDEAFVRRVVHYFMHGIFS